MRPDPLTYDRIPALPSPPQSFRRSPGIYCAGCGATFTIYSYSSGGPLHIDENGKPFYYTCFQCEPKPTSP